MLGLLSLLIGCAPAPPDRPPTVTADPSPWNEQTATTTGSEAGQAPAALNQLIVLIDDVGIEKLPGVYAEAPVDGPQAFTPTLDALADDGLTFGRAYSAPTCSPARAMLLTGELPRTTHVGRPISQWTEEQPDPAVPSLVEVYREAGYATAWLGKWHLQGDPTDCDGPLAYGFDVFAGSLFNLDDAQLPEQSVGTYEDFDKCASGDIVRTTTYATTDTIDDAIHWTSELAEPWLVIVSLNAAHAPFHSAPAELHHGPAIRSDKTDQFVSAIEAADTELARLLDAIPGERTDVWFMSDNGTPREVYGSGESNAKGTLFEGGIRVPMVVRGPGIAQGRTSALVQITDILPTGAARAGFELHMDHGRSLDAVLAGSNPVGPRTRLFTEKFSPNGDGPRDAWNRALRDDRWKLIVQESTVDELVDQSWLFDLAAHGDWDEVDLLASPLSPEAQEAYDRLLAELDSTWPSTMPSDSGR